MNFKIFFCIFNQSTSKNFFMDVPTSKTETRLLPALPPTFFNFAKDDNKTMEHNVINNAECWMHITFPIVIFYFFVTFCAFPICLIECGLKCNKRTLHSHFLYVLDTLYVKVVEMFWNYLVHLNLKKTQAISTWEFCCLLRAVEHKVKEKNYIFKNCH